MLVVGTRGRNLKGVHSLLPGSVSKYCLQHSPIPVIVVRPSPKREKKKKKRRADPTRKSYNQILKLSERRGGHFLDASSSTESSISKLPDEDVAVAEALGLPASYSHSHGNSRSSLSDRSSISQDDTDNLPVPYSLDTVMMKSPQGGSPASSEESVVPEETKRSPSPYPRDGASSPVSDNDSSDEAPSTPTEAETETEKEETTPTTSTAGDTLDASSSQTSIPIIEVSVEHDKDAETESQ